MAEWVQSISVPLFDEVMRGVSGVGWWLPASIITMCAGLALVALKQRSDSALLVVLVSVSAGVELGDQADSGEPSARLGASGSKGGADIVWISQRTRSVCDRLLWGTCDTFAGGGGSVRRAEKGGAGRAYASSSSYCDLKGVPGSPLAERCVGRIGYRGSVFGGTGVVSGAVAGGWGCDRITPIRIVAQLEGDLIEWLAQFRPQKPSWSSTRTTSRSTSATCAAP